MAKNKSTDVLDIIKDMPRYFKERYIVKPDEDLEKFLQVLEIRNNGYYVARLASYVKVRNKLHIQVFYRLKFIYLPENIDVNNPPRKPWTRYPEWYNDEKDYFYKSYILPKPLKSKKKFNKKKPQNKSKGWNK